MGLRLPETQQIFPAVPGSVSVLISKFMLDMTDRRPAVWLGGFATHLT